MIYPDAAKPSDALRINDMKSQFFISKIEKCSDNGTSQYLLGTHAVGTGTKTQGFVPVQILQYMLTDDRVFVDDAADGFQLFTLRMIENVRHQGHLFLPFIAHFVLSSFRIFVVILVSWLLQIYYIKQKFAATKCAFFFISTSYSRGWTLTWNCTHIANAEIMRIVAKVMENHGVEIPVICTPDELMGGVDND